MTSGIPDKRILLVSANIHTVPYPVYPLGTAYLAGSLRRLLPDRDVEVHDLLLDGTESLLEDLRRRPPFLVGISLRNIDDVDSIFQTSFIAHYRLLVSRIREAAPAATIVLGGAGFSIFPERLLAELCADYGVCGEGEAALLSLVSAVSAGAPVERIPGLVYRAEGKVLRNPPEDEVKLLRRPLRYEDDLVDHYWRTGGLVNIQTKRGCPRRCIYCTYPVIEGRKVRCIEPAEVVETIVDLYRRKGVDYFFVTDSLFNVDDAYNEEFARRLIAAKVPVRWAAYFSPQRIDRRLLWLLRDSGLCHVEFGTDSLSETMLERYNKGFTVADVIDASDACREAGVFFAHFLIVGGWGETVATVDETIRNAERITKTVYFPFIGMRVYPGTALHGLCEADGALRNADMLAPQYYVAPGITPELLKSRTASCAQRWVYPDENLAPAMLRMRQKGRKGPLWEYLIR